MGDKREEDDNEGRVGDTSRNTADEDDEGDEEDEDEDDQAEDDSAKDVSASCVGALTMNSSKFTVASSSCAG